MNNSFIENFRDKKVLITGHTGFKGSWLLSILSIAGAKIHGYSLPPTYEKGLYGYAKENILFNETLADIRDKECLKNVITTFQPDFIFHLAAQPLVRYSYQHPTETFDVNVIGTSNVLESLKDYTGKCVSIIITTDKVYRNHETFIHYKEEDSLGGYDPYSASKACAELVVDSFRNAFFSIKDYSNHQKKIASVRAGNVIGGGDWSKDRIIPDIVKSLMANEVISVRNPSSIRPWQHVIEPLSGYLQLADLLNNTEDEHYIGAFNFGPEKDDHITVKQLVEKAIGIWGEGNWTDASDPNAPHEAGILMLSIEKAKKMIGWTPKLEAASSIAWTIEWYKQQEKNKWRFTLSQINQYFNA